MSSPNPTETPARTLAAPRKSQCTLSNRATSPDATLRIKAKERKDGTAEVYELFERFGEDIKRGSTKPHPDYDTALVDYNQRINDAISEGWIASRRGQRPDTFDAGSRPKPVLAPPSVLPGPVAVHETDAADSSVWPSETTSDDPPEETT